MDRFHIEPCSYGSKTIVLVDAVFQWCESLRGAVPVGKSLKSIAEGLGAEAIALSRIRLGSERPTRQICFDCMSPRSTVPVLKRSFAAAMIGDYVARARPGTIWLQTVVELDIDPALELFQSRRKLRELAVIPLSNQSGTLEFLELHFASELTPDQHVLLNTLAGTFSRSWISRDKGVFLSNLLNSASTAASQAETIGGDALQNILSVENPARLSRAEYRVCMLLSRGVQMDGVCKELSIAESTLRTHLRNIYSKTSAANLPELLHLLFSSSGRHAVAGVPNVA